MEEELKLYSEPLEAPNVVLADASHYDVDINPVIKAMNQKKPKGLLRAVWEQLCAETKGQWEDSFASCAFDGRRNAYTPVPFPVPEGQSNDSTTITSLTTFLLLFGLDEARLLTMSS